MRSTLLILTEFLAGFGRSLFFLAAILRAVPGALLRPRVLARQIYHVGNLSLIIIVLSGSFVGMVLALQGYRTLAHFGASDTVGVFVALVTVRELGPVVTALLFAGRAGSSLAAGLGLMKATDQLSGMEMMAVDPVRRVVAPRFLAGIISMPLLSSIFMVMALGVAGGWFISVSVLGVDDSAYWLQIHDSLRFADIRDSLTKSLIFGATISWIAVYQGYHAAPTAEGVSQATTSTVVISSLAILCLDFVLTALMFK